MNFLGNAIHTTCPA